MKASDCASARSSAPYRPPRRKRCTGDCFAAGLWQRLRRQTYTPIEDPDIEAKRPRRPCHRLSIPDTASSIESRAPQTRNPQSSPSRCRVRLPPSAHDGHLPRSDRHLSYAASKTGGSRSACHWPSVALMANPMCAAAGRSRPLWWQHAPSRCSPDSNSSSPLCKRTSRSASDPTPRVPPLP